MVPWEIEGEISAWQLELHPIRKINVNVSRRLMFHIFSSRRKQRTYSRAYNFVQRGVKTRKEGGSTKIESGEVVVQFSQKRTFLTLTYKQQIGTITANASRMSMFTLHSSLGR